MIQMKLSDSEKPLYLNGNAIYRPSYKNAHIKTSNDGYIQAVSIFVLVSLNTSPLQKVVICQSPTLT